VPVKDLDNLLAEIMSPPRHNRFVPLAQWIVVERLRSRDRFRPLRIWAACPIHDRRDD
jgi:hypothetical protein